jgi:hypothetical protein
MNEEAIDNEKENYLEWLCISREVAVLKLDTCKMWYQHSVSNPSFQNLRLVPKHPEREIRGIVRRHALLLDRFRRALPRNSVLDGIARRSILHMQNIETYIRIQDQN